MRQRLGGGREGADLPGVPQAPGSAGDRRGRGRDRGLIHLAQPLQATRGRVGRGTSACSGPLQPWDWDPGLLVASHHRVPLSRFLSYQDQTLEEAACVQRRPQRAGEVPEAEEGGRPGDSTLCPRAVPSPHWPLVFVHVEVCGPRALASQRIRLESHSSRLRVPSAGEPPSERRPGVPSSSGSRWLGHTQTLGRRTQG